VCAIHVPVTYATSRAPTRAPCTCASQQSNSLCTTLPLKRTHAHPGIAVASLHPAVCARARFTAVPLAVGTCSLQTQSPRSVWCVCVCVCARARARFSACDVCTLVDTKRKRSLTHARSHTYHRITCDTHSTPHTSHTTHTTARHVARTRHTGRLATHTSPAPEACGNAEGDRARLDR
jgi:hypothetical protein